MIILEFRNKKTNDFIGDDAFKSLEDAYKRIEALKVDSKLYKGQIAYLYDDEVIDTIDFDEVDKNVLYYKKVTDTSTKNVSYCISYSDDFSDCIGWISEKQLENYKNIEECVEEKFGYFDELKEVL